MNHDGMNQLRRASRRYRSLFAISIVCVPVFDLLYWAFFNHLPEGFLGDLPVAPGQPLSVLSLALAFLVSLLPVSVAVYGLVTLRALFGLYENAVIFSADNVRYFRRLGYAFMAWVMANALFTPLISVVLTFANPAGEPMLMFRFGVLDLSVLIIGGIVLVVSWVMDEGRKLEDEQAHTVKATA